MRYALVLLLLVACGTAGEILGTSHEKQIEFWYDSHRCEAWGGAWVNYRPANSDCINIDRDALEDCDLTQIECVLEGLREHGPTYHPLWVMEEGLWFDVVDAVALLNAENPGAYPEPEMKW